MADFYTSPYAGAFFYHLDSLASDEWASQLQDLASYYELLKVAETSASAGVAERIAEVYVPRISMTEQNYDGPWFKDVVKNYQVIPPEEYPAGAVQDDIVFAFRYTSFVINPVQYLHYLLFQCADNGVEYIRRSVSSLDEARTLFLRDGEFCDADLVVNCTGIGAFDLNVADRKNRLPIKGQTLLVENVAEKLIIVEAMDSQHPTESLYVIPRAGYGTLLTGTYLYGDDSTNFDPALTERIKARALRYAPELVSTSYMKNRPELVEVRQFVGIRPGREGGVNVSRDGWTIHNYGSAHSGYQNSYGLANAVIRLVETVRSKL
ncbi:hypothetical protein OGAPHI_006486 [Ogataea philodendri]|uniref:FAD dependent oxidoreductase domain-containing protein n=1 Tax=Ogataea philodendri TaxID=1378263 RepID=A0A9P8T0N5_9ASCO|nr:uncharacterized protein OGAPHI_006486 [Ogataea philodendri]KAH3661636.1 hypothetical protein OGAPHI_006486 [Ogataea philodendri]